MERHMVSPENRLEPAAKHLRDGRFDLAELECFRILEADPSYADAMHFMGVIARRRGDMRLAVGRFERAVSRSPRSPMYRCQLAEAYRSMGLPRKALSCCETALRLCPDDARVHNSTGLALLDLRELPRAEKEFRAALALAPKFALAKSNLGTVLREQGRHEEAMEAYREATLMAPNLASAHNNLGSAFVEQGQHEAAIRCFERSLEITPNAADTLTNLGQCHAELGEREKAHDCYREAIRCRPDAVMPYVNLAVHHSQRLNGQDLAAMAGLLEKPTLNNRQRASLHFGRAYLFDARSDFRAAAEEMAAGNACQQGWLAARGQTYWPREHQRLVDSLMHSFDRPHFERVAGWGLDTETPVFILGLPRSGTTLTEQILASHPDVHGAGELHLANAGFRSLPKAVGMDAAPAECLASMRREHVDRCATRQLEQLREIGGDARRVVDKMPENYLWLGWIVTLFPNARIIHCRRDLRDVAVSCWITSFRSDRWTQNVRHIADRFRQYLRIMDHWQSQLPVTMLEVQYEQTVADVESVARRVVEWVGMEWDPACLDFHKGTRPIRTASGTQVRQPIYTTSVARWKNYATALADLFQEIEQFDSG